MSFRVSLLLHHEQRHDMAGDMAACQPCIRHHLIPSFARRKTLLWACMRRNCGQEEALALYVAVINGRWSAAAESLYLPVKQGCLHEQVNEGLHAEPAFQRLRRHPTEQEDPKLQPRL
jgi:hypothetical protein